MPLPVFLLSLFVPSSVIVLFHIFFPPTVVFFSFKPARSSLGKINRKPLKHDHDQVSHPEPEAFFISPGDNLSDEESISISKISNRNLLDPFFLDQRRWRAIRSVRESTAPQRRTLSFSAGKLAELDYASQPLTLVNARTRSSHYRTTVMR